MKPWERYQKPAEGPWSKFAPASGDEAPAQVPYAFLKPEDRAESERLANLPFEERGGIANFVTGADRRVENIPVLSPDDVFGGIIPIKDSDNPSRWENIRTSTGMMLAGDYDTRRRLYETNLKSAGIDYSFEPLPNGEEVLRYMDPKTNEWKYGYIDAPGFDAQDSMFVAGAVGTGVGLSRIPGVKAGTGKLAAIPYLGKGLAGGTVATGESLLMDAGADFAGADVPAEQYATNAAGSFAAGALIPPLAAGGRKLADATGLTKLSGKALARLSAQWDNLRTRDIANSPEAKQRAKDLIIDALPDDMRPMLQDVSPDDLWDTVGRDAYTRNLGIEDLRENAAVRAFQEMFPAGDAGEAGATPFKAYITQQPSDYAALERAQKGGYGPVAQDMSVKQVQQNNAAMNRAMRGPIMEEATGGPAVTRNASDAANIIRGGVNDVVDARQAQTSALWAKIDDARGVYAPEAVSDLPATVRRVLPPSAVDADGALRASYATESDMLAAIDDFARTKPVGDVKAILGPDGKPILTIGGEPIERTLQDFAELRKTLGDISRKGQNSMVAKQIMRGLDEWEDSILQKGLFYGDDGAIDAYRAARRSTAMDKAEFTKDGFRVAGQKTKTKNVVGEFIENVRAGKYNDYQIATRVMGGSQIDKAGVRESNEILEWMSKTFGDDSVQMKAVREEAYRNLFFQPDGTPATVDAIAKKWAAFTEISDTTAKRLFGRQKPMLDAMVRQLEKTRMKRVGPVVGQNLTGPSESLSRFNEQAETERRVLGMVARMADTTVPGSGLLGEWLADAGKKSANGNLLRAQTAQAQREVFTGNIVEPTSSIADWILKGAGPAGAMAPRAAQER